MAEPEPTTEAKIDALVASVADWPDDQMKHYAHTMIDNSSREQVVGMVQGALRRMLVRAGADHVAQAYSNLPRD